ncbi:MAG: glycosyltransferase family 4 protein [Hyphomicrobium sp.]|nr:glycosyltransferase family 4 protein [Hyphomicrobium sp.]
MKLIFVNRYFHPDLSATSQKLSELAFALAAEGHDVHIVTSRQEYERPHARLAARDEIAGVKVWRCWSTRFGRSALVGRAVDYATFYLTSAVMLLRLARRWDVVVAKTDPPMLSVLAAPIARLKGAVLVNWLQDIFPEVATELGMSRSRVSRVFFGFLRGLRNRSLLRARTNVVLGERMADVVAGLGVTPARIRIIPNWGDGRFVRPIAAERNALRTEWGLAQTFVVGYSGNLGRAHDISTFVEAISLIEGRAGAASDVTQRPIAWVFIGGGALVERLRSEVEQRGLTSVTFRPYQPRERLAESLSVPDVHLISLRPELEGLIVPSKYYGIAAAGRPAIFIGDPDGEIARLLDRTGTGFSVPEGDAGRLVDVIRQLAREPDMSGAMGTRARAAFLAHYDLPQAVAAWTALLSELTGTGEAEARPSGPAHSGTLATGP